MISIGLLAHTLPYSPIWDGVRWLCAVSGCALVLFYLRIALRPESLRRVDNDLKAIRYSAVMAVCLLLPAGLNMLDRIGKPVLPWLLPVYAAGNLFGWLHVKRRL